MNQQTAIIDSKANQAIMAASVGVPPKLGYFVELHLSCQNLKDTDVLSKSDPLVAVYSKTQSGSWTELGRTECVKNSLNPSFTKSIEICYRFEEKQDLKFTVYDIDNPTESLSDDELLGSIECSLGEVVSERVYTRPLLSKGKKSGTIKIQVEEVSQGGSSIELNFSGHGLDKKDLFGKSDPYLELSRMNEDGSYTVVHRNDYIKNTLNPVWPTMTLSSNLLCNNNPDRPIMVKCFDWDADGGHDLIGEFKTSLKELQAASDKKEKIDWKLINAKKTKKKNYDNSGTIRLDSIKITRIYSFLEYIMGGTTINFTVGIDFTASNGDPDKPSSLHYYSTEYPNEYMNALRAVGYICQDYDSDKLFPSFGFGGQIEGKVSHRFPLNFNPTNPYCAGVEGIVAAYHQALRVVDLLGPTNMAPIINHVADFAEEAASKTDRQDYFVLLILTDGEITDMIDTKKAIIRASRLPMSIIIVGVGSCTFLKMVELDSDDSLLRVGSSVAERDIVQFVPYRKYAQSYELAQVVLAEIPTQFTQYMNKRGLAPLKGAQ